MPTFTMVFSGLILHFANGNNAKTAVLVDAPGHDPKLVIPSAVSVGGTWRGKVIGPDREYDLKGCKVTIDNIDTTLMTIDPVFAKRVPSLRQITDQTDQIGNEVTTKTINGGITAAFVDFSGGTLSVKACFESEVVFDPAVSGDPRCIGQTIQFDGKTTAGEGITINNGKGEFVVLPEGIEVRIQNTSGGGGAHHKEYKRLMRDKKEPWSMIRTVRDCSTCMPTTSIFVELDERKTERLLEALPELRKDLKPFIGDLRGIFVVPVRSVSIECSNSQWP